MRAFTEPLQEPEEFQKIQQALKKQSIQVTGCIDAQKAHFIYAAGAAKKKLIVTYSELRAKELCENYRLFDKNVLFYPAKDLIFYSADVQSNLLVQQRIRVLQKLMEEEEVTIVTTLGGIMDHLLPPVVFQKQIEPVESDSEFDIELWKKNLTAMCYERVGQVEGSGQFAVRGGILDIFPLTEENPVRIELWGDEIDSIRSFDVESQRSIENLDRIRIYPAGEFIADDGRIKKGLAVLEKEGTVSDNYRGYCANGEEIPLAKGESKAYLAGLQEVLGKIPADDAGRLLLFGEQLYLMPEHMPATRRLHVLRPGLHLGTVKKNRLEPAHALALAISPLEACHSWNLSVDEARAYLSGQTFPAEGEKGWYLITVDGYSLGWGKLAGSVMKNHYPKGLRKLR